MTQAVRITPPLETARTSSRKASVRELDDLLRLDHEPLATLYAAGVVPSMPSLDGDLRGRMLHVAQPSWLRTLGGAWAGKDSFPWRGKSFSHWSDTTGEGMNRVGSDRVLLFRFRTSVIPSRHDGAPCVNLDYDLPGNPFVIRAIEDEVREIQDGLFLGQAYLRVGLKKHFVLWFGLTSR